MWSARLCLIPLRFSTAHHRDRRSCSAQLSFWTRKSCVAHRRARFVPAPRMCQACSSSASAEDRTQTAFSNFTGRGPSHAARWLACWIPRQETLIFKRRSPASWQHVPPANGNVLWVLSPKLKMRGLTATAIIGFDIDGAKVQWMRGVSPCPTRTRAAGGFYLPARGPRMTSAERFRLQGSRLRVLQCRQGISYRQLGMTVGNALTENVLGPPQGWPSHTGGHCDCTVVS